MKCHCTEQGYRPSQTSPPNVSTVRTTLGSRQDPLGPPGKQITTDTAGLSCASHTHPSTVLPPLAHQEQTCRGWVAVCVFSAAAPVSLKRQNSLGLFSPDLEGDGKMASFSQSPINAGTKEKWKPSSLGSRRRACEKKRDGVETERHRQRGQKRQTTNCPLPVQALETKRKKIRANGRERERRGKEKEASGKEQSD